MHFYIKSAKTLVIRDLIPLKQGLRLNTARCRNYIVFDQRPYTIKTRIKTFTAIVVSSTSCNQRPYTIKTRIKTQASQFLTEFSRIIRDLIPLKQGLRLHFYSFYLFIELLHYQRPYTIKTRIKTYLNFILINSTIAKYQRPYTIKTRIKTSIIDFSFTCFRHQRPYTIKTRIKTKEKSPNWETNSLSETIYH